MVGEFWHQVTGGGGEGDAVRLWRTSDGALVASLPHPDDVYLCGLQPRRPLARDRSEDNRFRLWRLQRNERLGQELGVEDDAPVLEIGDAALERNQRALAVRELDLEQVARAIIFDAR